MNPELALHRKIRLMLKLNLTVEEILISRRGDISLGPDAQHFREALDGMLLLQYEISGQLSEADPPVSMTITEKSHYLQHSAMLSHCISPRLVWAFSGEDQQRRVQTLGKASVRGLGPARACFKLSQRYRAALHFQFQAHKADSG